MPRVVNERHHQHENHVGLGSTVRQRYRGDADQQAYGSGSTSSLICGDLRAHAGRIAKENCCRSTVSGSTRLPLIRDAPTPAADNETQPTASQNSG